MSTTTVFLLDLENKCAISGIEYKNAWGSAPYVWDRMARLYLHRENWMRSDCQDLWNLFHDVRIPAYQRAVLGMTFDRAVIYQKDYPQAIMDIRKFLEAFPPERDSVNHWCAITFYIEGVIKSNKQNTGIGFWMTSVSDNPLSRWNEETESEIIRDDLYDLYANLEAEEIKNG
jgi:hypothetical protein